MGHKFEDLLDEALSQLNSGDGIETILARFPAHAVALRPLLTAAAAVQRTPPPVPDEAARQAGLERLLQAVAARRQELLAVHGDALVDVVDQAVAHVRAGEDIETVLRRYPRHAAVLRPILQTAAAISRTPPPVPNERAREFGRQRLLRAVAAHRRARAAARLESPALSRVAGAESSRSERQPEELPEVLDRALTWLREGVDLEAVLLRFPTYAEVLRPMLRAAEAVRSAPPPIPSEEGYFAGRRRLLHAVARRRREMRAARVPGRLERLSHGLHAVLAALARVPSGVRRVAVTVALLALMILGSFSVTHVAASALPDSPLYPVKRLSEHVQLILTPSIEGKARLHLMFGQERLREAESLARRHGEIDPALLSAMLAENDRFFRAIRQADPDQQAALLDEGMRLFKRQRQVLSGLTETVWSEPQREFLKDVVGRTGEDQAIAEEVRRDLRLVELIPTPAPLITATPWVITATPRPATATRAPATKVPATSTSAPPTRTPVPPTPTLQAEIAQEPLQGVTATPTATTTLSPTPTLTPTPTQLVATPPSGGADTATPAPPAETREPTATPVVDIGLPTLEPQPTP